MSNPPGVYEVTIGGWFSAAHQLRFLDGTLEPLHGHNWRVQVTYSGQQLDSAGVLIDFTRLKPVLDDILSRLHERHLNDCPAFRDRDPSAENVAVHIAEQLGERFPTEVQLACVEVEEAPGCIARFRPA